MPDARTILLFLLAALPICLTPGPGMLYVVSRGSAHGRRAAVLSSLGLSIGTMIHTLLIAFGVARLLAHVPLAYDLLRFGGAAYLVWLGVRLLTGGADASPDVERSRPAAQRILLQGVLTGTLNPKVALFLLAFLPQFVTPANGNVALQIIVLGVFFEAAGSLVNLAAGLAAGTAAAAFRGVAVRRAVERISGLVCMGLGVRLAGQAR